MNALRLTLENLYHADVLKRLVAGATTGDADAFMGAAAKLTWSGGWADALRALVPLGTVPDTIRTAFERVWEHSVSQEFGLRRTLACDLLGQDQLLADGLRLLLPQPVRAPLTLYRLQSLKDYRAGQIGAWWDGDRSSALWLWLNTSAACDDGKIVLLQTEAPAEAIVAGEPDELGVVVDPRRLGSVRAVGVLQEPERIAA
ncbi:hypothetical protein [Methylorubrum extorquens]|uniref:Uncharacterized protein n=1 Tax=Methylorubrum extorquens (strain CM4 / NCIMB 13688) TaxID=440085 RepID=B7KWQ0_METC4|nr:hypothetical protein [Methylorubrum extorquens]ACK86127.1 hypothetical protein Mchl_5369 [Methylorubrum extorquens CM4]